MLKKLDEYGFEDFAVFADSVVVMFANSSQLCCTKGGRWDELPELVRAEIVELLDRQLERIS